MPSPIDASACIAHPSMRGEEFCTIQVEAKVGSCCVVQKPRHKTTISVQKQTLLLLGRESAFNVFPLNVS